MTDRELLELAAKAAGFLHPAYMQRGSGVVGINQGPSSALWNPLTDDGDAFRLALKLGITVMPEPEAYPPQIVAVWYAGRLATENVTDRQDRYAAARRAIVRAAVAAGEWLIENHTPAAIGGPHA